MELKDNLSNKKISEIIKGYRNEIKIKELEKKLKISSYNIKKNYKNCKSF